MKANGTTVSKIIAANPMLTNNPKYNGGSTIFSGTVITLPSAAGANTGLNTAVSGATNAGGANTDSQNAAKYTSNNTNIQSPSGVRQCFT